MRRRGFGGQRTRRHGFLGSRRSLGAVLAVSAAVGVLAIGVLTIGAGAFAVEAAADETVQAPDLSLTAAPAKVKIGRSATLAASIGFPGAVLEVSARIGDDSVFTPTGSVTTGADGSVSWKVSPRRTTTYRVQFAGDRTWAAASAETTVSVTPHIAFLATRSLYSGQSILFRVATKPLLPDARLELQVLKNGSWERVRGIKLSRRSRARVRVKARRRGTYRYRVVMAADASLAAATSRTRKVRVKNGNNPYRIPVGPAHFIVVDRSQYKLYYHEHGNVVRVFNCVLGRPGLPTPVGRFRVWSRGVNPGGPFGVRVLWYYRGYGIHGTNQPWLLDDWPRAYSHGCTRLSNANALWLFNRCPVGTPVWNVP